MSRRSFSQWPDLLTVDELSEALMVSKKTAYKLLRERKISSIKAGREYRIPKIHVMTYLGVSGSS